MHTMKGACIEWRGRIDTSGYGRTTSGRMAHAVAWESHYGEAIPKGLECCHICDNPPCVAPAHLFLGTHAANMVHAAVNGRMAKSSAKLTPEDVRKVRTMNTMGYSQLKLAEIFGVNQSNISRTINRKTWR